MYLLKDVADLKKFPQEKFMFWQIVENFAHFWKTLVYLCVWGGNLAFKYISHVKVHILSVSDEFD